MIELLKHFLIFCMAVTPAIAGCKEKKKVIANEPPVESGMTVSRGYNFTAIEKREMKKSLKEISGIHYLKDGLFVAIEDEEGIIFTVDFATGKIQDEQRFAGSGDYEDITMDAAFFYVLRSDGTIYKVSRNPSLNVAVSTFGSHNKGEFESIYLDSSGKNLVMVCKHCPGKKKHSISAYAFNLQNTRFNDEPLYSIDLSGFSKAELPKTSAAAIHPIEKKLYVLCSVGKTLLICNLNGKIEKVYDLDPSIFQQPEGITFAPNGDMYISNESNFEKANILKLTYLPL